MDVSAAKKSHVFFGFIWRRTSKVPLKEESFDLLTADNIHLESPEIEEGRLKQALILARILLLPRWQSRDFAQEGGGTGQFPLGSRKVCQGPGA